MTITNHTIPLDPSAPSAPRDLAEVTAALIDARAAFDEMSQSDQYSKHADYDLRDLTWELQDLGVSGPQLVQVGGVTYEVQVPDSAYAQVRRVG